MTEKSGNNPRLNLGTGARHVHGSGYRSEPAAGGCAEGKLRTPNRLCVEPNRKRWKTGRTRRLRPWVQRAGRSHHHQHPLRSSFSYQQQHAHRIANCLRHELQLYTYGSLPANPQLISQFNSANLPTSGVAIGITGVDPHLKTTYVMRYSIEGQYDLGHEWVATLGYSGSDGPHLPCSTTSTTSTLQRSSPAKVAFNPTVNSIDWYEDSGHIRASTRFLAEARHQFAHTFEADVEYRWSHSWTMDRDPTRARLPVPARV